MAVNTFIAFDTSTSMYVDYKYDKDFIKTVAEAIRKNGVKQVRGKFILYDYLGEVVGACAIGQAGLNLAMSSDHILLRLNRTGAYHMCPVKTCKIGGKTFRLGEMVIHLNDCHRSSFNRIANYLDEVAQ